MSANTVLIDAVNGPVERGTRKSTTLTASYTRPANACGVLWSAVEQQVCRESWQDDLERKDKLLRQAHQELAYLEEQNSLLQQQIVFLENLLADKEAEIVRLNTLLEGQAKRKYR